MDFKRIEDLSINECLDFIQIKSQEAKVIAESSNSQDEICQRFLDVNETIDSQICRLVIDRLAGLLLKDKNMFFSSKNKSDFQNYLSERGDGLWRKEAELSIKRIEDAEKEKNLYAIKNRNKIIIKFVIFSITTMLFLHVSIVFCVSNYHSASYINVSGQDTVSQLGGNVELKISSDADIDAISISSSDSWIKCLDYSQKNFYGPDTLSGLSKINDKGNVPLWIKPNYDAEKTGYVKVIAYSTFFGYHTSSISRTYKIHQFSGKSTFMKLDTYSMSFDRLGSSHNSSFLVQCNGINLEVIPQQEWISVKRIGRHTRNDSIFSLYSVTVDECNDNQNYRYHRIGKIIVISDPYKKVITIRQGDDLRFY